VQIEKRWLFDGAVVNPVPVNVCRALGADVVIAVNVLEPARPISATRADQFSPAPVEDVVEPIASGGLLSVMRGRG
jgi:predicted acylesterase/phospholipase RssA